MTLCSIDDIFYKDIIPKTLEFMDRHCIRAVAHHPHTPTQNLRRAREAILKAAISLEGRIAAEHGIGIVKRDMIGWNLDAATLALMQQIKALIDPNGILNPGKLFPSALTCGRHAGS